VRRPLALLPGLLCDRRLWAHQIEGLADIADPWVADLTRGDTIAEMARAVLDAMPERFALAGLSMGGYVAQEVMRQAPERVTHLCLADTSARADSAEQVERRRALIKIVQTGTFRGVTRRLLPTFVHRDLVDDPAVGGVVQAMAEATGREAYARQQRAILARADGRADLALIDCPTLVICGRQDTVTPLELSQEIARGIAGARLAVIEDCCHLPALERPGQVTALMREWLAA